MQYYYKDFYDTELKFAKNFVEADRFARKLSDENETGLAEVVVDDNGTLFIVATYCRGTKRFQGKKARDAQRQDRPPTK